MIQSNILNNTRAWRHSPIRTSCRIHRVTILCRFVREPLAAGYQSGTDLPPPPSLPSHLCPGPGPRSVCNGRPDGYADYRAGRFYLALTDDLLVGLREEGPPEPG